AGDGRGQELLAQLIGAETGQCRGAHVGLHADGQRHTAAVDGAEFFGGDDGVAVVQAHAAEFFRLGDAQQAQVAGLLEELAHREATVLLPLVNVGVDLLVDEVPDGAAQFVVFLSEVHCCCPSSNVQEAEGAYRRATPKVLDFSGRTSASAQISSKKPSSLRVSRGSMRPSSHRLAVPYRAVDWLSSFCAV